jgi:hypothetical protein
MPPQEHDRHRGRGEQLENRASRDLEEPAEAREEQVSGLVDAEVDGGRG